MPGSYKRSLATALLTQLGTPCHVFYPHTVHPLHSTQTLSLSLPELPNSWHCNYRSPLQRAAVYIQCTRQQTRQKCTNSSEMVPSRGGNSWNSTQMSPKVASYTKTQIQAELDGRQTILPSCKTVSPPPTMQPPTPSPPLLSSHTQ